MSWPDPAPILALAFPLWFVLFPERAVRFYRWFHGLTRMHQRRLDAMTARQFRIAGALFLAFVIAVGLFSRR